MPTLTELQRNQSLLRSTKSPSTAGGEELVADSRAALTPSQLVERKLAARNFTDLNQLAASALRPRAK